MKVWVTGEAGIIARSFQSYCDKTKKHEFINSLSNDEYDYWRKDSPIKTNEIDIFDPTLETIISRSGAEIIVHAAETKSRSDDNILRTNIVGSFYVSEIAKKLQIPLIYISSPDTYKITDDLLDENCELENSSIYTYSKSSAENLIKMMLTNYTIITPGYLYGPHDDKGFITNLIRSHYGKVDSVEMNIDPESPKSFLFVDDFSNLLGTVISNQEKYNEKKLNACFEEYYSYSDIIENLEELGLSPEFYFKDELDIIKTRRLKNSKIYNWKPKTNLLEGLEKTLEWLSNERLGHISEK